MTVDFMEGFAQATALLRELIKGTVEFQWTPECQKILEKVNKIIPKYNNNNPNP